MSASRPAAVVVLAAGEGTRMRSSTPKVLHPLLGRPMLGHVLDAVAPLDPVTTLVVVGHGREQVTTWLSGDRPCAQAFQRPWRHHPEVTYGTDWWSTRGAIGTDGGDNRLWLTQH